MIDNELNNNIEIIIYPANVCLTYPYKMECGLCGNCINKDNRVFILVDRFDDNHTNNNRLKRKIGNINGLYNKTEEHAKKHLNSRKYQNEKRKEYDRNNDRKENRYQKNRSSKNKFRKKRKESFDSSSSESNAFDES